MSFFTYLDHLRSKPEGVKRQIALGLSLLLTGFILVLWLLNLRLTPPNSAPTAAAPEERNTAAFWSRVGRGWQEVQFKIKEGWQAISR